MVVAQQQIPTQQPVQITAKFATQQSASSVSLDTMCRMAYANLMCLSSLHAEWLHQSILAFYVKTASTSLRVTSVRVSYQARISADRFQAAI